MAEHSGLSLNNTELSGYTGRRAAKFALKDKKLNIT
jgi:hypothetical protein